MSPRSKPLPIILLRTRPLRACSRRPKSLLIFTEIRSVLADQYKIDFYGAATSSILHQIGTDRLWVSWPLDSRRVRERLQAGDRSKDALYNLEHTISLVQVGANNEPQIGESTKIHGREDLLIEIPSDINALQRESPELAARWREATRRAFKEAIASGYTVEEFYRFSRKGRSGGLYLLSYGKKVEIWV